MDLTDLRHRKQVIGVMREVVRAEQSSLDARTLELLIHPAERAVYKYAASIAEDEMADDPGKWYRSVHNGVVACSDSAMNYYEGYLLVSTLASNLHDTGYENVDIAPSAEGADWESVDKRVKHAQDGAIMSYAALKMLNIVELLDLSRDDLNVIADIILKHDDRYLGKEFGADEYELHRLSDADRCFVMSAASAYKDYVVHFGDEKYLTRAKELGFEGGMVNLRDFLRARSTSFWAN